VYLGTFVRSAIRRSKQVRFRRERVVVEVPPEESAAHEQGDTADEPEKIEVHVHVHRGERKSRSKRPSPPVLTGALFDWQWYKDRLSKRPPPVAAGRWSRIVTCESCGTSVRTSARHCPRCGVPIARRRFMPFLRALVGLGSVGLIFGLGVHFLGPSVPESRAPTPLGQWSSDDVVIVEVPPSAPPINSMPPPTPMYGPSGGGVATP